MRYLLAVTILVSLVTAVTFGKERPDLDPTMIRLFNSLMNLEIMAVSPERFKSPENKEIIQKDLETLFRIKHSFPAKMKSEEPGMMAVLSLFTEYIKDTKDNYERGNSEYARHRVKTMGSFCLSCHSRNMPGWDFEDVQNRVDKLPLRDFEKAELYGATRQFDKALASSWLYLEGTPKTELDFIQFTRTLRNHVRLLVRVKQDPIATKKMLDLFAKRKGLPEFDRRLIRAWQKDAEFWVKDKVNSSDLTPEALFKKAEGLISRATSLQSYPSDDNGDISYLRATSYLHEILDRDAKSKTRGRTLYLLGIAYGSLKESYLWDLDALFFEQCIRENAHTELSRQCFERYIKAIYINQPVFSESFLSEDALKKMGELGALCK